MIICTEDYFESNDRIQKYVPILGITLSSRLSPTKKKCKTFFPTNSGSHPALVWDSSKVLSASLLRVIDCIFLCPFTSETCSLQGSFSIAA